MEEPEYGLGSFRLTEHLPTHEEIIPWFKNDIVTEFGISVGWNLRTYDTFTAHPQTYLDHLLSKLISLGVKFHEEEVHDITPLFVRFNTNIVVNCSGLGNINLKPVIDKTMYPVRGQTVVVKAPVGWKPRAAAIPSKSHTYIHIYPYIISSFLLSFSGIWSYMIPRTDRTIVLGGTSQGNVWKCNIRESDTKTILDAAKSNFPDLSQNLEIVSINVGLRPGRFDGVRLESQRLGKSGTIIHNYGHGSAGWQMSWGCAQDVLNLIKLGQK